MKERTVYFVFAPRMGLIKIGVASSVLKRIKALQCATGEYLCLLGTLPGGHDVEAEIHRRFAESRVRGEWFLPSYELLSEIGLTPDALFSFMGTAESLRFDSQINAFWEYDDAEFILRERLRVLAGDYEQIVALHCYIMRRWGQAPEIPRFEMK